MRLKLSLYSAIGCLILGTIPGVAQNHYKILFKGVASQTNRAGTVTTQVINQQTWLRDFAREKGLKSIRNLAVSYHFNADSKGDMIEVIDVKTGEVQGSIFGLFFSEAFGRTGLTNAAGTQTKTLQYLYTSQDSHSMGAAVVTKTLPSSDSGYPKMQGQMQYELLPTSFRKSLQVCSGNFVTGPPIRIGGVKK